jgi:transposase
MEQHIIYVGLDVHKDTIAVALAEAGKRGEVREHGKIVNTPAALKTLSSRLARNGARLRFCYEAGPCGYGIQRQLNEAGHECVVVAPSLIPRKAGDRVKTDRRDAVNLAKLHRAGELSSVWVPDPIRDLYAGETGGGARAAAGTPAAVQLPTAPWTSLSPAGMDPHASTLAGGINV